MDMKTEVREESRGPLTYVPGAAIQRVSYSHDKMIDLIIANPRIKQDHLAQYFGYTPAWVSRIMSSDAFRLRMEQRREELVNPIITATLEERFADLALRGAAIMQEKLDQPAELVSFADAAKAVELGAKGLAVGGFGSRVSVDVSANIDLRGALEEAQKRREELIGSSITVDVVVTEEATE